MNSTNETVGSNVESDGKGAKVTISLALLIPLIGGVIGYGKLQGQVETQDKRIKQVEKVQRVDHDLIIRQDERWKIIQRDLKAIKQSLNKE